jgi:hypothetical protein
MSDLTKELIEAVGKNDPVHIKNLVMLGANPIRQLITTIISCCIWPQGLVLSVPQKPWLNVGAILMRLILGLKNP